MALFAEGNPCVYCRQAMHSDEELIGFTFVGSESALVRPIDDCVVHRKCLSTHPQRDEIVKAWNQEAKKRLGPKWMLETTKVGTVRHLTWFGSLMYQLGLRT